MIKTHLRDTTQLTPSFLFIFKLWVPYVSAHTKFFEYYIWICHIYEYTFVILCFMYVYWICLKQKLGNKYFTSLDLRDITFIFITQATIFYRCFTLFLTFTYLPFNILFNYISFWIFEYKCNWWILKYVCYSHQCLSTNYISMSCIVKSSKIN